MALNDVEEISHRMEIELYKDSESEMLIPYVDGTLHREMFEFLVYRYHWPKRINANMKAVNGSSLRNIAYDVKQLLESLSANDLSLSEVHYDQLQKLLDAQQRAYGWNNGTYNTKYLRCREFFDFLSVRSFSHNMIFPARGEVRRKIGAGEFYSDDADGIAVRFSRDDGKKRTTSFDNYDGSVISMQTYGVLYQKLGEIDPVYSTMAQTMMQTCLRISNACQIPLSSNKLNPKWLLWPEFQALGLEFLRFNHIGKGRKPSWCYVWPVTLKAIYTDYVEPYFKARKHLYIEKYCRRKNASLRQGPVSLPENILWLTEKGTPVKPYMVEEAFRNTGLGIRPHDLRHTGATHLLWNYCRLKGIDPDERMAGQFQSFLQFQLGHVSIETTRYYIRTIVRKRAQIAVPFALPGNHDELDAQLPIGAVEEMKMLEFFAGAPRSIVVHENTDFA